MVVASRRTAYHHKDGEMTETVAKKNMSSSRTSAVPGYRGQQVELGRETVGNVRCANPFMVAENVNVYYGDNHAIKDVTLEIGKKEVVALIGPSGCGKSTFLRCLNRMNDTIESARVTGNISLDGRDIYDKTLDPVVLRARVGMVFQKPT